ncbi:MAG: DNA polymerase III subunit alpha [Chloroflexota bacterium]
MPKIAPAAAPAAEYAELHAHTNFSLLDGTSDPEIMVDTAATLGQRALAITDHDSVSGIIRFAAAAKKHETLKALIGVELTLEDDAHVVLLIKTFTGYENICKLLTHSYACGGKDNPHVTFDGLAAHASGLIALSGCPHGELPKSLAAGGHTAALETAARYRDAFGKDNYYVELSNHLLQSDPPRNAALRTVAKELGIGLVATNDAHYHDTSRALFHHVVTCIKHRTTLAAAGTLLRGNDEYYLKSPAQMARLFHREVALAKAEGRPELDPIRSTIEIAHRCEFNLKDLRYQFPKPYVPTGESDFSFLVRLVAAGKSIFYPSGGQGVKERLAHELEIVRQMNLAGYLLVFKEVVDWSHQQGILCSIRGSAPASALLYCLGLCPIDPLEHNLLFERFCSPERDEYPDIDLDFAHERREEVIQHTYEKYGRDCVAMVCEVNTYRAKSALRDVAKVLGLSPQRAQQLADQVDWYDPDPAGRILRKGDPVAPEVPRRDRPAGLLPVGRGGHPRDQTRASALGATEGPGRSPLPSTDPRLSGRIGEVLITLTHQLQNTPRHHSIHVGGMVVSARPLFHVCPIEPARMKDRTVIPWDKDDVTLLAEEFGINLIKMDFLGLGMLSLIGRCFKIVKQTTGEDLRLHGFKYDPHVYQVISAADTVGLFQIESRAQQSFLPRLKPENLSDVAISVGAIRPGPGAARAGEHIVRRRQHKEAVTYPAPGLEEVLKETLGVLLWQEQCIQVAVICAGYTPGQGDQLRRAMSHKRSHERMSELCDDLVARMLDRGHPYDVADSVRKMIVGFAGYGFPRAHAYPFAHLALISATLRLRYPAAYYAAILNCQPMGFYAPHTLLWDARRHGVRVLPVDVNLSEWECILEPLGDPSAALRLGLEQVTGLGNAARVIFERERAGGPFASLSDFVARTGFDRERLEKLAEVGALLSLPGGEHRREAVWQTGELAGFTTAHVPGLAEQLAEDAALPMMTDWEEVQADYRGLGYSVDRHVISYYRPRLDRWRALSSAELARQITTGRVRRGVHVRVGGLVIVRQRPETAGHVLFMTLEDETGLLNAIVYPNVYEKLRPTLRGEPLLVVEGPLQVQDGVTHILVRRAWPLVQDPSIPRVKSHDFH